MSELLNSISAKELDEWRAFDRISPIGDERGDLQAGIITSWIATSRPGNKKSYRASDFMPYLTKQDKSRELSQQIRAQFMAHTKKA